MDQVLFTSFQPSISGSFLVEPHVRRFTIDEMDTVTLAVDVRTTVDEVVPTGTVGTVVAVWGQAEAFEIEFDDPFTGLATIQPDMIREHRQHISYCVGIDRTPRNSSSSFRGRAAEPGIQNR